MSTNTDTNTTARVTLPGFEWPTSNWYEGEARYFLSTPEERVKIRIYLSEYMGEFASSVVSQWEEDR